MGTLGPMAVALSRMSAAEYLATPEDRPQRTELINGTIVVSEPKLPHQRTQGRLYYFMQRWIDDGAGRGEVWLPADITIDDLNVFAPDVWWVSEARAPGPDAQLMDALPDLVVEIRSPSTWARDLAVKLPAYEAVGVPEAWYVDTEAHTVLVFRRSGSGSATFDVTTELGTDEALTSPMLVGFELGVGAIFQA